MVRGFGVDEFGEEVGQEVKDCALEFCQIVKDRWRDGGVDGSVEKSYLNELDGLDGGIGP